MLDQTNVPTLACIVKSPISWLIAQCDNAGGKLTTLNQTGCSVLELEFGLVPDCEDILVRQLSLH